MSATLDLIDVIDLRPMPGEYVGCKEVSAFDMFGVKVDRAFHRYHAARIAVQSRWDGRCECCNHTLRYAYITQDESGAYHCHGHTCLNIATLGQKGERKLHYSRKVEQKERGFVATFNVPCQLWELPRNERPSFARIWKGRAMNRRGGSVWKLSVWGGSFEECLANCESLGECLGIKLT